MKKSIKLSPLGTARRALDNEGSVPEQDAALLDWLGQVREQIGALYNLEEEILYIAYELARWQMGINLVEREALILLILVTLVQMRQGSTRIALHDDAGRAVWVELAERLLGGVHRATGVEALDDPSKMTDLIETLVASRRLGSIIGGPDQFTPLIITGRHLYLQKMLLLEDRFVAAIGRRLASDFQGPSGQEVEAAVRDVAKQQTTLDEVGFELNHEQQAAVQMAVRHPMTIISGGPGTGKTTIVISILRVLGRLGVAAGDIALAAPTGKAAHRMSEVIQAGRRALVDPKPVDQDLAHLPEPRTLHRLLGYQHHTGRFTHHENNRLGEKVIIVDESSMIDLALMEQLVRALRDDCRFILLGDDHQLPSIEAGTSSCARPDRCGPNRIVQRSSESIRLSNSHRIRQNDDGRNIFTVAHEIDQGKIPDFAPARTSERTIVERPSAGEIAFRGVEFVTLTEGSE